MRHFLFVPLISALLSYFLAACDKKNTAQAEGSLATDDSHITDHEYLQGDDRGDISSDIDVPAVNGPVWTITESDISWHKQDNVFFHQWGTAAIDAAMKIYKFGDQVAVLSRYNISQEYHDQMMLSLITGGNHIKNYLLGSTFPARLFANEATQGKDGRIFITAISSADLGKTFEKNDKQKYDACVIVIDPKDDSFSFFQWGNEGYAHPETILINDDGSLTVAGFTDGAFPGQELKGKSDIFISRIETKTGRISTVQYGNGTPTIPSTPRLIGMDKNYWHFALMPETALPGQTFFGGPWDAGIIAIDRKIGFQRYWQFGTDNMDFFGSTILDEKERMHFIGTTFGTFAGQKHIGDSNYSDLFYGYFENGKVAIVMQYGTDLDEMNGALRLHKGTLYHTGSTSGACENAYAAPKKDILFAKIDPATKKMTCVKFGDVAEDDLGYDLLVEDDGTVYIAGNTQGAVGKNSYHLDEKNAPRSDAFLMKTTLKDLGFE
ncbi:MAG TPA: hypothetical protein PKH10_08945 [bacterium]|nr:hypothetical protein [bacterium]